MRRRALFALLVVTSTSCREHAVFPMEGTWAVPRDQPLYYRDPATYMRLQQRGDEVSGLLCQVLPDFPDVARIVAVSGRYPRVSFWNGDRAGYVDGGIVAPDTIRFVFPSGPGEQRDWIFRPGQAADFEWCVSKPNALTMSAPAIVRAPASPFVRPGP